MTTFSNRAISFVNNTPIAYRCQVKRLQTAARAQPRAILLTHRAVSTPRQLDTCYSYLVIGEAASGGNISHSDMLIVHVGCHCRRSPVSHPGASC